MSEAISIGMEEGSRAMLALLRLIAAHPKPVVAAVRGHVRAGGIGLVGACDVAVVTDDSTFAFTEALLGLTPAVISLTTSSRLTDRDAALKYLTGARFDGAEAARAGLVTQAVPADAFDGALASVLGDLAKASPQGSARPRPSSIENCSSASSATGSTSPPCRRGSSAPTRGARGCSRSASAERHRWASPK